MTNKVIIIIITSKKWIHTGRNKIQQIQQIQQNTVKVKK